MTKQLDKTIIVLSNFNKWRRGAEMPMPDPADIGEAIDFALETLRKLQIFSRQK